jgi:hypothetical protein
LCPSFFVDVILSETMDLARTTNAARQILRPFDLRMTSNTERSIAKSF